MSSAAAAQENWYLRLTAWLERLQGRQIVLILAGFLSLPNLFSPKPSLGLDSSWQHSLQAATTGGRVYGRDVLFTYGPLGYLLTRSPVSKLNLLLYDAFILATLLSLYRKIVGAPPLRPAKALFVLALAMITKEGLQIGSAGILFIVAGYWLWRLYADESYVVSLLASLAASVLLFFSKANFGLMTLGLIPCSSLGLLALRRDGRKAAGLAGGFALLIFLGAIYWKVDLRGYLRASLQLAGGYNEAMFEPLPPRPIAFLAGVALLLGVLAAAVASWRTTAWQNWIMICPFVTLTAWLLFKNAFVRADVAHIPLFLSCLPLLLAVWSVALPSAKAIRVLLALTVVCGIGQLEFLGYTLAWFSWTPLRYARGVVASPWRQNGEQLGAQLRALWPELTMPANIRQAMGRDSVDVMPCDSSFAILNGLNLKERPVPQTYAAFTPWLDGQNASFLSSSQAPGFILYMLRTATNGNSIDQRPAAWDESLTKRKLLENYTPCAEFQVMETIFPTAEQAPVPVVVLKRSPQAREYEPILTNDFTLAQNQPFEIPPSTNYQFLWLEVERSALGKLAALASNPAELTAEFTYSDGASATYRAILPILKTGVLINYRIESPEEIRQWLKGDMRNNVTARSIRFKSVSPWAFRGPFRGRLVTCRLVPRHVPDSSFTAER